MVSLLSYTSFIFFAFVVALCSCASLGPQSAAFGSLSQSPSGFQSWHEWAKKRGLGASSLEGPPGGFMNPAYFQDWREYMSKRGLNIPDTSLGKEQFQSWMEWSKKRSLLGKENKPFPSSYDGILNTGNYQDWADWLAKRGAGMSFGHSAMFGAPVGMQSWDEYMKRQGFGHTAGLASFNGGAGIGQGHGMQSWNEWAKRSGMMSPMSGSGRGWGLGAGLGDKSRFMDWESLYKQRGDKRQLSSFPGGVSGFNRYFTDGLQDWRSAFHGSKRDMEHPDKGSASSVAGDSDDAKGARQ